MQGKKKFSLPQIQQKSLFQELVQRGVFKALKQDGQILDFVASIWEIDLLPSTDPRFKTLRADIKQHFVDNDDWDDTYLFSEKLGVFKDEGRFQLLIELIPSDKFQRDHALIQDLVELINRYLLPHGQRLVATKTGDSAFTTYEIRDDKEIADQTRHNKIPFLVEKNPRGRSDKPTSHSAPIKDFPSFVLVADNWDDYGWRSLFYLYYYPGKSQPIPIGKVKIIFSTKGTNNLRWVTKKFLPDKFTELPEDACSLGQEREYYTRIKEVLPDDYRNIFRALNDCAVYSHIEDSFDREDSFGTSLLRDNEAERLLRDVKFLLEGIDVRGRERLKYHFGVPFSEEKVVLDVEFDVESLFPGRILAIVGKNGVGKTQMLSQLPRDLSKKKHEFFEPQLPRFSKVVSISTSLYDHNDYPESSDEFYYEYIGLTSKKDGVRTIMTEEEIDTKLIEAGEQIKEKGRADSLAGVLAEVLPPNIVEELFPDFGKHRFLPLENLEYKRLPKIRRRLSSGESTLLYLLTCIIATMRYDTLLLFDEPETHLHPNAITMLISALYKLLREYQSYAIVVTHSPLVIREIKATQVRIMDRFGDRAVIQKIQQETLGANISSLVDEIFGNMNIPKYYRERIKVLINKGEKEDTIIRAISSDESSLPLGLRIYIKSCYITKDEEG